MLQILLPRSLYILLACLITPCIAVCQNTATPLSPAEHYRLVGRLIAQKDYVRAIEESKKLIERAPESEHAYSKLAKAANAASQPDQIKIWLEVLTLRTASNPRARYGIGLIEFERKNYAATIEHLRRCLSDLPDFDLAMLRLVDAWFLSGQKTEAEAWLKSLIDAQPKNPTAHLGLGYLHLWGGQTEASAKEFETALSLNPRTTDACSYLISAWYGGRRFANALDVVRRCQSALEDDQDEERRKDNLSLIGSVYQRVGQYQNAVLYFQKARTLAGELGDRLIEGASLGSIGSAYLLQADYAQALVNYQRAFENARDIKDDFNAGRILGNIGEAHYLLGDLAAARQCYEQAIEISRQAGDANNQASVLIRLGQLFVAENKPEQAIASYEQSLVIAERRSNRALLSDGLTSLARLYLRGGEHQKALEPLRRALQLAKEMASPEDQAKSLNHLGELYLLRSEPDQAIAHYEQALKLATQINSLHNVWQAYSGMAAVHEKLGQFNKAREHFRQAIEVMEQVRSQLNAEEQKSGFFSNKVEVYQKLIALLMRMHRADPTKSYADEAFNYTQRARARSFLDTLRETPVRLDQQLPADLLAQRQALQIRFSQFEADLRRAVSAPKPDAAQTKTLEEGLQKTADELRAWQNEVRRRNPGYAGLRYPQPLTLEQVQKLLGK